MIGDFAKEFFSISKSSGSIITEALELIKTFQKIGAAEKFIVIFSPDCRKLFSWASDIFKDIISNINIIEFSELELFYMYNYVLPIMLLTLIVFLACNLKFYVHLWFSLCFFIIGNALGNISYDKSALYITLPVGVVFLIINVSIFCCNKDSRSLFYTNEIYSKTHLTFTFALINAVIIGSVYMLPIFMKNIFLIESLLFIYEIVFGISIIVETIISCKLRSERYDYNTYFVPRINSFLMSLIPLLIIPTASHFMNVINNNMATWNTFVGYVILGFGVPIAITVGLIYYESPDMIQKYRIFPYFEIIDILKQITYAILAACDLPLGCLIVEIAWIVAVVIVRPYSQKCEYVLQTGNSAIIVVDNALAIVYQSKNETFLSFGACVALVVAACIPAVVTLFVFFACDFSDAVDGEDDWDSEDSSYSMLLIFKISMPFVWLSIGIFIPSLSLEKKYTIKYD